MKNATRLSRGTRVSRTAALLCAMVVGAGLTLGINGVRAAGAPSSRALSYSGYLALPDGSPVNGPKYIALSIHDSEGSATKLCEVPSASTNVSNGHFQFLLPDECSAAVKTNPNLFVQIQVDGATIARTKLGAVPYALEASRASEATHAAAADSAAAATGALDTRIGRLEQAHATQVIDAVGPYPITSSAFQSNGGTLVLTVSASAFRGAAGTMTVYVDVDGVEKGQLHAFTNETSSHKSLVAKTLVVPAAAGAHTIGLRLDSTSNSDKNDYANVTVLELAP